MKNLLFSVCLSFLTIASYAQLSCTGVGATVNTETNSNSLNSDNVVGNSLLDFSNTPTMSGFLTTQGKLSVQGYLASKSAYSKVKGSPYWHKAVINANIVNNDNSVISDVPVQYDVYADEIIATNDQGEEVVLDARFYKAIVMEDGEDYSTFKKAHPDHPSKFYEVLYESEQAVFFKDIDVRYKNITINNVGKIEKVQKFLRKDRYYIFKDDMVTRVNLKKNEFFELFPEIQTWSMNQYIKQNKMKMKSEDDFIELLANLNP